MKTNASRKFRHIHVLDWIPEKSRWIPCFGKSCTVVLNTKARKQFQITTTILNGWYDYWYFKRRAPYRESMWSLHTGEFTLIKPFRMNNGFSWSAEDAPSPVSRRYRYRGGRAQSIRGVRTEWKNALFFLRFFPNDFFCSNILIWAIRVFRQYHLTIYRQLRILNNKSIIAPPQQNRRPRPYDGSYPRDCDLFTTDAGRHEGMKAAINYY